jgi:hypothetical protein
VQVTKDFIRARHTRREAGIQCGYLIKPGQITSLKGMLSVRSSRFKLKASNAMEDTLKSIHGDWMPAVHAGLTNLKNSDHVISQIRIKENNV